MQIVAAMDMMTQETGTCSVLMNKGWHNGQPLWGEEQDVLPISVLRNE
jgi:hypothetical protein